MTVCVLLTLKPKEGSFEELEDLLKAILPDTAARDGAELISCSSDAENNTIIVYELWDKIESQQAYIAWRAERGDLDVLGALLGEPPRFDVMKHLF
ncbi:MAG: putative quinol monooxygenase [Pikeienuella sp.]